MIERIHLSIVLEIDRLGSMTAAAKALCLTQSALSHSIRKLKGQLGTELWSREGRELRPTQAGRHLLSAAQRILPQLERTEKTLRQFAMGERGDLKIGMECHPCYQWLLKVVSPFLEAWPDVDVDVRQKFQFGGIAALFAHEIDLLVTPDPVQRPGLRFEPVFDYEQVLVVPCGHSLARAPHVLPRDLVDETLITYPVPVERLDVYSKFLLPAGVSPMRHQTIETTDIMLQMVASGRGVAALPRWLAQEFTDKLGIVPLRLGPKGIPKKIYLGIRKADLGTRYVAAFIATARSTAGPKRSRKRTTKATS